MKKCFVILQLLSLASCMTPEQEAQHLTSIRQAQFNQDHNLCTQYGSQGTEVYSVCHMKLNEARSLQSRTQQDPWAHYMLGLGNSLASSQNPNVVGALGEASTHGVNQFMRAKEYNEGLEDKNLKFKKSMIDYLDQVETRKQERLLNDLIKKRNNLKLKHD